MLPAAHPLAIAFADYLGWILLAAAVLAGLVVGHADVIRFRLRRVWAISSVCFTEAMRRRVWLVTPLAIAGVLVVSQLQQAADDQDAIRQTIRFCLFTSGLVVCVIALILASTNLPREIESRVIYTIVTKPTTRLEIVLGKIVGFARVSALVLLIMGVFTYGYLELRNHRRVQNVMAALALEPADSVVRPTLAHYAASGFLETKSLEFPVDLHVYSRPPSNGVRWMRGGEPHYFIVPFEPTSEERGVLAAAAQKGVEVDLVTNLTLNRVPLSKNDETLAASLGLNKASTNTTPQVYGPQLHDTAPATIPAAEYPALIRVRLLDAAHQDLVKPEDVVRDEQGVRVSGSEMGKPSCVEPFGSKVAGALADAPQFYVEISPVTPGVQFGAGEMPVTLYIPAANNGAGMTIRPLMHDGKPVPPLFYARPARFGMQLTGSADQERNVAVFIFRNAEVNPGPDGKVAFQVSPYIERPGDYDVAITDFSVLTMFLVNQKTHQEYPPVRVTPELNRSTYFDVPIEEVAGGDFDVALRALTPGQIIDVNTRSLAMVTADSTFAANLFKSLLLLWMLSILVVTIAVFCSTFLSWPIAIVLSLVVLLGRWGVAELGDSLNPGVGRMVTADFKVADPTESKVVSSSVEALAKMLKSLSAVLPDVSKFPATDDIASGISIPMATLEDAGAALLVYGLTLAICGYIILRFKEVAP